MTSLGTSPGDVAILLELMAGQPSATGAGMDTRLQEQRRAWLSRVATGDRAAFAELYDDLSPTLYGLLRVMLPSQDADDALQEAFLQLWRQAGAYDPARGSVLAWAVTLSRSRALDQLRHLRAEARARDALQAMNSSDAHQLWPDTMEKAHALQRQLTGPVAEALAQLPEDQQAVLMLSYFWGLTHPEIAGLLTLPLGTVKTRIRLAVRRLRGLLDDWESQP